MAFLRPSSVTARVATRLGCQSACNLHLGGVHFLVLQVALFRLAERNVVGRGRQVVTASLRVDPCAVVRIAEFLAPKVFRISHPATDGRGDALLNAGQCEHEGIGGASRPGAPGRARRLPIASDDGARVAAPVMANLAHWFATDQVLRAVAAANTSCRAHAHTDLRPSWLGAAPRSLAVCAGLTPRQA